MTKEKKILLGILSFLPILLFAFYFYNTILFFWHFVVESGWNKPPEEFVYPDIRKIAGIVITGILLGLLLLGVFVYFLIHAINNQFINRDERIIWILVFIFVGMITFPLYWYLRIWKIPSPPTA